MSRDKSSICFFDRRSLFSLKQKALRSGAWFRSLRRIDRALVDLTLIVADRVRNPKLAKTLSAVMIRLENALRGPVSCAMAEVGFPLARHISNIGARLGHTSARQWATDYSFARFLAVMHLNDSYLTKH